MAHIHNEQPGKFSDQLDIDFKAFVEPPMATYVDTLAFRFGWGNEADMQVSLMYEDVVAAYQHFGGKRDQLPISVDEEDVIDWLIEHTNKGMPYTAEFVEQTSTVAYKYLNGDGDDYSCVTP